MAKLAPLLDKYDTIIFDLDGVITTEQKYWDCVALTVYQLFSDNFDVNYANRNVGMIRTIILYRDKLIRLLKNLGVNSNWDMCYCICAFSEILGTYDTPTIYNEIEKLNFPAPKIYEYISENSYFGERGGDAYNYIVKVFQEWFYGDEKYREKYGDMPSVPGKKCINGDEIPLFDLDKTIKLLKTLSASKRLGIATGRITDEAVVPLKKWGIYDCFCENNISTYSDILKAEQQSGVKNLTKPHEFSFLSAALGKDASTDNLLNGKFDKTVLKRVLAVGDAAADLFSAQNAGIDFAAVLSGIEGKNAKSFFEKNGANFIINDIFDLTEE